MKSRWSSRLTFILATTGAAVGLGNIWKFPYMVGENGGGAFVLLYLVFVALIGIPILMAEIVIGRLGRENAVLSLKQLALAANRSPHWQWLGWWGALGLVLVLSFYSVVAGWSIGYLAQIVLHGLEGLKTTGLVYLFWAKFIQNPYNLLLWHTLFMTLTLSVVALGVKSGLERATKILMPCLFFVLIMLVLYSAEVGDLKQAIRFLLKPNFSAMNSAAVIYALGHAFFTLALGAGTMLVYGAYLPQTTRIGSNVTIVALLDVLVALLSGVAIFSIVFAYHLSPEGGPGLMFKVLPIAFAKMPAGVWVGGLFFLLLWFAAWASSISMAEPLVVLLQERLHCSRRLSSCMVGLVCWILGGVALLSFNTWQDIRLFGRFSIFDAMADLTTNIILPMGGLGFAVFAGWILNPGETKKALGIESNSLFSVWQFLIRYIAPLGIIISFIWNFWI